MLAPLENCLTGSAEEGELDDVYEPLPVVMGWRWEWRIMLERMNGV